MTLPAIASPDARWAVTKFFTLGSIVSSPVVDTNVVCAGSTDGCLYALMQKPRDRSG